MHDRFTHKDCLLHGAWGHPDLTRRFADCLLWSHKLGFLCHHHLSHKRPYLDTWEGLDTHYYDPNNPKETLREKLPEINPTLFNSPHNQALYYILVKPFYSCFLSLVLLWNKAVNSPVYTTITEWERLVTQLTLVHVLSCQNSISSSFSFSLFRQKRVIEKLRSTLNGKTCVCARVRESKECVCVWLSDSITATIMLTENRTCCFTFHIITMRRTALWSTHQQKTPTNTLMAAPNKNCIQQHTETKKNLNPS